MDLFKFDIGPEAHVEAKIEDGKALIRAEYKGEDGVSVKLEVSGSPKFALDKLKGLIPGGLDDMAIDMLEGYLGLK